MARERTVLARVRFDARLPTYFMLQSLAAMAGSLNAIPLIPIWLIFGGRVHRRQYESLSCELTTRSLDVKRGFLFRVQQNIPLDKITDLAVHEGPILRHLGLCSLKIETAGGGQAASTGQAHLPGVVEAEAFRDLVLAQRDAIVLDGGGTASGALEVARSTGAVAPSGHAVDGALLTEIRDALLRIEKQLEERGRAT
jgi:putative membrane protein